MNQKIILTDCDGCLLDWERPFDLWMNQQGFYIKDHLKYNISSRYNIHVSESRKLVRSFNESANMEFLPPLRDAVSYVKKLHDEHGYKFHCITSLTKNEYACQLRKLNIERLFGSSTFEKFVFLDTGEDKDNELKKYQNTNLFWIEDKIKNCEAGLKFGLKPILIMHEHSQSYNNSIISTVTNWKEIYNIITSVDAK